MSDNLKLNNLALMAKNGCKESLTAIYKVFIPIINRESERIWMNVHDQTSFELDCRRQLKAAVKNFDDKNIKSFYNLVCKSFYRIKSDHLKRRSYNRENLVSIESVASTDDEGRLGYQFKDESINVSEEVLSNIEVTEKAVLLAEDDSKKMAILKAWIQGYNDSEVSEILANLFGGKASSHRVYVARFKTECRKRLGEVA